jgi:hypothetical protein
MLHESPNPDGDALPRISIVELPTFALWVILNFFGAKPSNKVSKPNVQPPIVLEYA